MSIADNPLTGPMRKSMGNFTMYSYNGLNIVRSKTSRHRDAKTEKQLNNRERMTVVAEMYRVFGSIIAWGFPEDREGKAPQNMFVSANFSTAFDTTGKKPVISYPRLLVAKGSLPAVKITEAFTDAAGITVRYDAEGTYPEVTPTDEIIGCARLKTGELLITRQLMGFEMMGTVLLKYPNLKATDVTACYVFVLRGDGSKASNSVWVEVT
jgi:hypothetical protein